MKKLTLFAAILAAAAWAGGVGGRVTASNGLASGTGAKTIYTSKLGKVGLACPYLVVAWKACEGSGGQLDAGLGGCSAVTTANGRITDFSLNTDPIEVYLGANGDRVQVVNVDAGTVSCEAVTVGP